MSDSKQEDFSALGFGAAAEEMRNNFKHVEDLMKTFSESHKSKDMDPFKLNDAYTQWYTAVSKNPSKTMQDGMEFWQKSMQLSQHALSSLFAGKDQEKLEPVITEGKGDRRFKHEDWTEKNAFSLIKQSYLLTSEWMRNMVTDVEGLDPKTAEKVKFFTERYLDSLSPTNFAATNPAVIEKIIETKGANLVHGLKNMLEDLEEGEGQLKIRMTDTSAFTIGENVATTPGKVVFQNKMFQLIQYSPSTETVLKRPLLIVPPWINKFYILDLQPKNSMLKWLVDQGHTVFVVSWVNPDETYRDVGFEDYVTDGVIAAVDAVEQATGESEINAIGYCIGGTLLSTSLAYMKARGDNRVKSATFFTTMIDFAQPGELGVFIDEDQVSGLEKMMEEEGCLKGSKMSGSFNLLRANELIWSFYVNNYLLGNDPRPFDLLYWNSDSTRMTPTMHSWYLRNMYMDNKLREPNALSVNGTPIDISSIDIPVCFISTIEDHIAPWLSTYSGAKLFSGDVRFILGGSGHIAGIINPPDANKYGYRVTDTLPDDPQAWADQAQVNEGSWWPNWNSWVRPLSDNEVVKARVEGKGGLKVIEDAPGTYVKCKIDDPSPVLEPTKLDPSKKPVAQKQPAQEVKAKKATPKTKEVKVTPKAKKATAPKAEKKPEVTKSKTAPIISDKLSEKPNVVDIKTAQKKAGADAPKAVAKSSTAEKVSVKTNVEAKKATSTPNTAEKQVQLELNADKTEQTKAASSAKKVSDIKPQNKSQANPAKDDLTVISGIGPKVEEMLNTLGFNTYADIAAATAKSISEKMEKVDIRNRRFDTTSWPKQAAELIKK